LAVFLETKNNGLLLREYHIIEDNPIQPVSEALTWVPHCHDFAHPMINVSGILLGMVSPGDTVGNASLFIRFAFPDHQVR
jgi:hypothetical protein